MIKAEAAAQGSFYAGGRWTHVHDAEIITDQMYVAYRRTGSETQPPVVLVHGGGMTGSVFESTPDGRPGWAARLHESGYPVYVVDQPGRGRSRYHSAIHGDAIHLDATWTEQHMTASEDLGDWPQASLHTQWPGTGRRGDAIFDAFFAGIVGHLSDYRRTEPLVSDALIALLETIGPSILLTHSQSGNFGWQTADRRPDLVRAIVAVEPSGPPFFNIQRAGAPPAPNVAKPYGITTTALTFYPPLYGDETLTPSIDNSPRLSDQTQCYIQAEPARQLPQLSQVPVLVITGEASLHAQYDHATVRFLRQAGVRTDHLELADIGIHGNGHLMMAELNSDEIATAIHRWLSTIPGPDAQRREAPNG